MTGSTGGSAAPQEPIRKNLCLALPKPNAVLHDGDPEFPAEVEKLYRSEESKAIEGLISLKAALRQLAGDDFWAFLAERLAHLLGAQMAFVSKRMLVDEQDRAVEMPPIGEPGACLMASALYYNDGRGTENNLSSFRYHAYGCPCSHMRHDKVFVVPDKMGIFSPKSENPNELPIDLESYIGIPLFGDDGKCFAHFAVIWAPDAIASRKLSWATIELLLHSLEDIILDRLLDGSNFRDTNTQVRERNRIIPHAAVTAAQSLKPYARSLSHELRTPMQGVVGMLDVMYATVLEASENQTNSDVRRVFESLRENIEAVQDSSRRAVEAADNVVHAYDMDMHVPDIQHGLINGNASRTSIPANGRPSILVAGSNLPIQRPNKRRREDEESAPLTPSKIPATDAEHLNRLELSAEHKQADLEPICNDPDRFNVAGLPSPPKNTDRMVAPGLRHTQLRHVLQYVVNEGLKVGGRPESAIARETELGEIIEVQTTNGNGDPRIKIVEWSVDPAVPTAMFVDEKDLGKLISCIFLNAFKFTEQGKITVKARMSAQSRHVVVTVRDSGPGIPKAFLPRLFTAFSQEDPSLTRQTEGLGLGLLVAKGLCRKLGGDLTCSRTETGGPNRGSDFELRVPVSPLDHISRPLSPLPYDSPRSRETRGSDGLEKSATPSADKPTPATEPDEFAFAKHAEKALRPDMEKLRMHSLPQTPRSEPSGFKLPSIPQQTPTKAAEPQKRPVMLPRKSSASVSSIDRDLANRYPLTFLVAEDNKINRKLLVSMLNKFGYKDVHEAYDGAEAVRQMEKHKGVNVVLMDLWMPFMDGYEATAKILSMDRSDANGHNGSKHPTVLAVSADVTDAALERAAKVGMKGFMTKPFKLLDLQRLILEYCATYPEDVA